jgi:rhamnosyltransferase
MPSPTLSDQLLIAIVRYNKPLEEIASYHALIKTSNKVDPSPFQVFIYDNSHEPIAPAQKNIHYKHDILNSGVSKAYNEAAKIAFSEKKKWLILLDQDTDFDQEYIAKLAIAIHRHPNAVAFVPKLHDEVGIVSPFKWRFGKGQRISTLKEVLPLKRFRFANSGLLINLNAFLKAGGYIESIPLDFSDIAFAENLQKVTDHFVVVDYDLRHAFSGSEKTTFENSLSRFHYFCIGGFEMGATFGPFILYYIHCLLRAVKLTITFRKLAFIKIFVKHAIQH